MRGPIDRNPCDRHEQDGAEDEADHSRVHIHRQKCDAEMIKPSAKEKFEKIGERDVHEADECEIGEMGKEEREKEACIDFKGPTWGAPVDGIAQENEAEYFEKRLAERVAEEEEVGAPMRLRRTEEMGKGQNKQNEKKREEIEVVDSWFWIRGTPALFYCHSFESSSFEWFTQEER